MKKVLSFILALCMICTLLPATVLTADAADGAWTLVTDASTLQVGDQVVIVANNANYALSTTQNKNNRGQASVAKNTDTSTVTFGTDVQVLTLETGKVSGKFAFNTGSGYLCAASSSSNYLRTETTLSNNSSWSISITSAGVATIKAQGNYTRNVMQYNQSFSLFACYSSASQKPIAIYKWIEATTEPDVSTCEHTNKVAIGEAKNATCTEDGITAGEKCADCDAVIKAQETIAKLPHDYKETVEEASCTETGLKTETCSVCGDTVETVLPTTAHNYVDGACSVCGQELPSEATITFDDKSKRTEQDAEHQVWQENGITVTNRKASSQTAVADYANPARFYKGSELIVECSLGKITQIVFNCQSGYTAVSNSESGGEITKNSNEITFVPNTPEKSFVFNLTGGQVRVYSIMVTYAKEGSGEAICEHTNTEVIESVGATCTTPGSTEGLKCSDCGDVITEPTEIPATGHNLVNGSCSVCDAVAYQLVTDISSLKVGDKIIIVAHEYDAAMSTTDNGNYRGETAVTKNGDTVFVSADVQIVTLEKGVFAGTFAFNTGNGYLYAPTSGTNQLRTGAAIDENGSWKIEIADRVATVTAQGSNEDNQLQYNKSSTRFSCYSSEMGKISIYKLPGKQVDYIPAEGEIVSYQSWNEAMVALENVDSGTIRLMADQNASADVIDFSEKKLVIDLNGCTLTAQTIYATVMDSLDGKGLICTPNKAMLNSVAGQIILWDNANSNKGYRAFDYTMGKKTSDDEATKEEAEKNITNVKSFWNLLRFSNTYAYTLVASNESGLGVTFTLDWNGVMEQPYSFTREMIVDWAGDEEKNIDKDYGFYIRVTGFENLDTSGTLTVTATVKSEFDQNEKTLVTVYEHTKAE